jgi:chemotaxis protein MotC
LSALALVLALGLGSAQAGEEGKKAPPPTPLAAVPQPISDMLFDLQSLQASMAAGDKAAYAKQGERLRAIGEAILAAPAEDWKRKPEVEAAAAYLLGGGQPRVIQRLLESNAIPSEETGLLRGALAYVIGRGLEAEALLNDIDPRSVSLRLGAQLAFAQALLMTSRAPDRAIERLDMARLLAPGSLVEEAALRREILMTGDRRDGERVIFLARQYVTRFSRSIYADNFIQGLASTSVKFGLIDDPDELRKFEELLALLPPPKRLEFLLTVARAQTLSGNYLVAGAAADDALGQLPADSPEANAARFYAAASRVLGPDYENAIEELKAIDKSKLSPADRALAGAALHVAAHLRDEPSDSAYALADHENQVAAARSPNPIYLDDQDPIGATIRLGDATLAKAKALIGEPEKTP